MFDINYKTKLGVNYFQKYVFYIFLLFLFICEGVEILYSHEIEVFFDITFSSIILFYLFFINIFIFE